MIKKALCMIVSIITALSLTSCHLVAGGIMVLLLSIFGGTTYVDDPAEYGEWDSYLDIPSYLPDSIEDYEVNGYSYTLYSYMDVCYEIFLDISVTEEQLDRLIADAKSYGEYTESEAYYCDGYFEIVFEDYYRSSDYVYSEEGVEEKNVGWADIEKAVYNPETLNIIFVCFHANDSGVYDLDDLEYFKRFSIDEKEYEAALSDAT